MTRYEKMKVPSTCTVDLATGGILFIEEVDIGDSVDVLDREYVELNSKEYEVEYDEDEKPYIVLQKEELE